MLAVLLALAHGGDTVAHYWQQQVAYVISAALDEPSGVLTGQVRIRYVNRSPTRCATSTCTSTSTRSVPARAGRRPTRPRGGVGSSISRTPATRLSGSRARP